MTDFRYDPDKHHRRSVRLRGYDYRYTGTYFVTMCTYGRACIFGEIYEDGELFLNTLGCIAAEDWKSIPEHNAHVSLDIFVVMPNHSHAIIIVDYQHNYDERTKWNGTTSGSIGAIIQAYKAGVTRRINQTLKSPGEPVWQRNYYDRIIRNEAELNRIRSYILLNPMKWAEDENNPEVIAKGLPK